MPCETRNDTTLVDTRIICAQHLHRHLSSLCKHHPRSIHPFNRGLFDRELDALAIETMQKETIHPRKS